MARYEHTGSAPDSTLVGDITPTSTAITIASGTGWPTGAGGKFWVAIDPDTASEEHLLVNARSGTALTLTSSADRGLDDTSAQDHSSGATVRHIWSAVEADDVALQSAANTFAGRATFNGIVDIATSLRPVGAGTLLVQDTGGNSLLEIYARTDVSVGSTAAKLFWREEGGTFRYDSVTVGATGSGGTGKRALVVPN